MTKAEAAKMEKKWQAEHDLRTLIDAGQIKKDKTRYAAAMRARKDQMAALQQIADGKTPAAEGKK